MTWASRTLFTWNRPDVFPFCALPGIARLSIWLYTCLPMPRGKLPLATPATPTEGEQLTAAVAALTEQMSSLANQVEVLRIAIDDLRQEVEYAMRNAFQPAWTPTPRLTSMPLDPLAEDFGERVNRFTAKDLPPEKELVRPSPAPMSSPAMLVQQGELWT